MKRVDSQQRRANGINRNVIVCIGILVVLFGIANSLTPEVDSELDFFELTYVLGQAAASVFAFIVAKRYWGSTVFGRAYLSLGIACASYCAGVALYFIFQIYYKISYPFPYWPDLGLFLFYPFAIYHVATNVHFFRWRLEQKEKYLLVVLPALVTILYVFLLLSSSVDESATTSSDFLGIQKHDQQFWNGLYMGVAYVGASTLLVSYAMVGFRLFHKSLLGSPWGLLLAGFCLNWVGDLSFFYSSIYSYDRTNPIIVIWVASSMIICYALYKHRVL
jgi:hypothetical protein